MKMMPPHSFKIVAVESELYEWDKPPIWNGMHVYDKGRLHLICSVPTLIGRGCNGYRLCLSVSRELQIYGPGGYHTQVLAAINQACWDIHGKIEGKSVHALLGGTQERIRTYIAGGYYGRGKGFDELREEMARNINEFNATAVKMKIGDPDAGLETDTKRIEAVRETVGPDTTLMVDANCAWSVEKACECLRYCRQTTSSGLKSRSTATITEDTKHCAKSHKIWNTNCHWGKRIRFTLFQTLIDV
ncbi:Arabinonate dehydratase [Geodia barretti]|uniref:Arabinonate dehydratase n=1 Tax=Geodia barretti TaxID=519541 RepID=A0AA35S1S6_GEOBA|nr:Arabinonate dehydratase [Geodia barretti]